VGQKTVAYTAGGVLTPAAIAKIVALLCLDVDSCEHHEMDQEVRVTSRPDTAALQPLIDIEDRVRAECAEPRSCRDNDCAVGGGLYARRRRWRLS
jgi:hypothetical protein